MTPSRRSRRPPLARLLLLACAALAAAPGSSAAPGAQARRSELASAPSDRSLYQDARSAAALLDRSAKLKAQRAEWEKVVQRYRRVVLKYPQSGYCDDALLAVGRLYREMARRFKASRYEEEAVAAYRALARQYPSSRLGEPALQAVFEIASESGDRKRVAEAGRAYLEAYPEGPAAASIKAALRKRAPVAAAEPSLPAPPPPGLAQVYSLRAWSGESSTRVVLDVEKQLPIKFDRLSDPDRLFVDLKGARLHPNLKDRSFPVGDGLLEQVRIAQNQDSVVRVVLDFKSVQEHRVFYLDNPARLVVDVLGARAAADTRAPEPAAQAVRVVDEAPLPEAAEAPGQPDRIDSSRRVSGMLPPEPRPQRTPAPPLVVEGPAPPPPARAAIPPAAPTPPAANRSGQYSLARQLGLSARRIVIDPGHGGHDPGTIGRRGLQEKDLVLDVALRLEKLVKKELGAEVVMTRASDVFIPLEERTAIANARGADLFLSIHANASRNPSARGIETYFLSFARNAHAESVAARENAISEATLKDLQNLVKAIALNSKIDESRDFASEIQEALVQNLKGFDPATPDRGVHTAPFYVLIGANMPSVLAEIAFVSHPGEERVLQTPEHRERIARSLLEGIRRYLGSLARGPRPLTAAESGPRVAGKGKSR